MKVVGTLNPDPRWVELVNVKRLSDPLMVILLVLFKASIGNSILALQ